MNIDHQIKEIKSLLGKDNFMTRAVELIDILTDPNKVWASAEEIEKTTSELKQEIYKANEKLKEIEEIAKKVTEKVKNI